VLDTGEGVFLHLPNDERKANRERDDGLACFWGKYEELKMHDLRLQPDTELALLMGGSFRSESESMFDRVVYSKSARIKGHHCVPTHRH
jgi:hypothetical protein